MDEGAAASTISFSIAVAIIMAGIGGIIFVTVGIGDDTRPSEAAAGQSGAESLVDVLLGSAGVGWAGDPDELTRLGLVNGNGSGLDMGHIALMRGYNMSSQPNNLVDYAEAKTSLGLGAGEDFHLRIYPPNLNEALASADLSHLRAAYLGDWVSIPTVTTLPLTQEAVAQEARDTMGAASNLIASPERSSIVSLGVNFNDLLHLDYSGWDMVVDLPILPDVPVVDYVATTLLQGDVYPDDKDYLNSALVGNLAGYNLLFVGSGVDQNALTSDVFKSSVRDWVLAGGILVVFGSDGTNFQWLQPLFQVGTSGVSEGPSAPGGGHPVLAQPYELSWIDYDNFDLAWDIKKSGEGAHYDDFEHIIVSEGEDVLAISREGTFGSGRIFLTSYRIGAIADELGLTESTSFLTNMVLYEDRSDLYLEYGATIPDDLPVFTASRLSHMWDDDLGLVAMRVDLLYWKS